MGESPPARRPRVLVGVTVSPHAPAVLRAAKALSGVLGAEQIFVHVGRDDDPTRQRLAQTFSQADVTIAAETLLVRDGRPDVVLLNAAREREVDLVVIGALEQDNFVQDLIGSTARRVARRASCAVFLLVGPATEETVWRNLVVSATYHEASIELVRWVAALARAVPGARVHVVREYDPRDGLAVEGLGGGVTTAGDYHDVRAAAESYQLANFLEGIDFGGVPLTTDFLAGRPGVELMSYAQEVGADLLAVSAPGAPLGVWDRFFGHPVEALLQKLPCSLLIHRRRGG